MPVRDSVPHGTHRCVPRLVNRVHVTNPDVDHMIQHSVVKRHVVGPTIQLVLIERYQASVINEVVHRQPLLEDVAKVLLGILRPKQG